MKEKARSILFIAIILLLSTINLINPIKSFSNKENRYLQTVPNLNIKDIMSGKFSESFEKFTTDQFFIRDKWISLKTVADLSILKKDNTRAYFGKDGHLFEVDEKFNNEQFIKNIGYINTFYENIRNLNQNIDIHALLVPSKSSVLPEKLPAYAPTTDELELAELINESLNELEVFNLLRAFEFSKEEYTYYKTDHHWTTKGAFLAYRYYCEQLGIEHKNEDDFNVELVSDAFLGTLYRKANFYPHSADLMHRYLPKDAIDFTLHLPDKEDKTSLYDPSFLEKTDKYSYFLGGDHSLAEITTSTSNSQTLLVIKDSFANSFIPFFLNHYEKIIIIDPRYFNASISEYIKDKNINDVMLLFNIQNLAQHKGLYTLTR